MTTSPIKISVVIPCYNQEQYIAETLDSALAQTFPEYEIIVVNDGSVDSSQHIIEQFVAAHPKKITLVNQQNQGVISARNNGIAAARGTYIYPLDGDDKIHPECLQQLYEAMIAGKGDVIYSDTECFGERTGLFELPKATKWNMLHHSCVVCSALYSKADWERYGGYDQGCRVCGCEDWEFWLNFVLDNKHFHKVEKPLLYYRQLATSRTTDAQQPKSQKIRIRHLRQKYGYRFYLGYLLGEFRRLLYQKKKTRKGYTIVKIFRIPVWYGKTSRK